MDLFTPDSKSTVTTRAYIPLAERLRPHALEAVVGQEHLLEEGAPLRVMLQKGRLHSLILWGPPGCGKTTIARLLSAQFQVHLEAVSAVTSGVPALKKICDSAVIRHKNGKSTLLFVDEIHRFNRAQQDVFLPYVESGEIVLVGATTENPSFELNGALLSRCRVLVLKALTDDALAQLLLRAEAEHGAPLPIAETARRYIIELANGDGRYLLGLCEQLYDTAHTKALDQEAVQKLLQKRAPLYDKQQEAHYNLISALHKALRASDTDAALYWLHRMLQGGEDPHYILRRMARFAVEDIGLADPNALVQVNAAWECFDRLGSPEGDLAITQAVIYLGTAPKSNAAYSAHKRAANDAAHHANYGPPMHSVNAPTALMKELGYSEGYAYDHDTPEGCAGQSHFPDDMPRKHYYQPVQRGFERDITKRMKYWDEIREKRRRAEVQHKAGEKAS